MIEVAKVTLLSGESLVAARRQYPAKVMFFVEDKLGDRRMVLSDVEYANCVSEFDSDGGHAERQFVEHRVEHAYVRQDLLGDKLIAALEQLRKLVEVAQR